MARAHRQSLLGKRTVGLLELLVSKRPTVVEQEVWAWVQVCSEMMLFIRARFSNLYTAVHTPA